MKTVHISVPEIMFYGYYITLLLVKGFGFADGSIYKLGLLIASAFIFGKLMVTAFTSMEWIAVLGVLSLAAINRLNTGMDSLWLILSMLVMMKGVPVRRVMKIGAFFWPACFILQILTHLLGVRSFDFVVHNKFGLGYVFRWAMGYVHPNVLQISYNVVVFYLVYVYCVKDVRRLWKAFVLSSVWAIYIFMYSLSTTGMIMFIAFWIFVMVLLFDRRQNSYRVHRMLRITITALLPLEAGASILLPLILKGDAFNFIEKLMTHRPSLTRFFFTNYGISLFGQNPNGLLYIYTLDCSYANLLFHGGIIAFVLLVLGYFFYIHNELKRNEYVWTVENVLELAITLSCLVGAMSEPFAFNTSFKNVSLIFLGHFLFELCKGRNTYCVLNRWKKIPEIQMEIPVVKARTWIVDVKQVGHRVRAAAFIIGAVTCIVCGLLYIKQTKVVQAYYVCRTDTDAGEEQKEGTYLSYEEENRLQKDASVRVLNYKNPETQMVKFEGKIGRVEYVRGLVSTGVWTYIFGFYGSIVAAAAIECCNSRKKTI